MGIAVPKETLLTCPTRRLLTKTFNWRRSRRERRRPSTRGLNLFHAKHFKVTDEGGVFFIGVYQQLACHARVADFSQRRAARAPHRADELDGKIVRHINQVEQHAVTFFDLGGITDEEIGQLVVARIVHMPSFNVQVSGFKFQIVARSRVELVKAVLSPL